ncbi:MAG TPA: hypothetical protein VJU18_03665, partial [Vicinamibacteria bacterium]|nr:hypothetical protein [Vicinamibacteria bacterium]
MGSLKVAAISGIAVAVLVATAYAVRLSVDGAAASALLSLCFLSLCGLALAVGGALRHREEYRPLAESLLALGNLLVPVSLYAPALTWVPLLAGRVPLAASAVLAIGLAYHAACYRRASPPPLPAGLYPCLFAALSGGLVLALGHAVQLPPPLTATLLLALAEGFHWLARGRAQGGGPYRIGAALLAVTATASLLPSFAARPNPTSLLLFPISAALTLRLSLSSDALGVAGRVAGLLGWALLTTACTTGLFFLSAPFWAYLIATTAWVMTLTAWGVLLPTERAGGLKDGAAWLSLLLGLGLGLLLAPATLARVGLSGPLASVPNALVAPEVTPGLMASSFLGVGLALLTSAFWRGRYPTIAFTRAGFVAGAMVTGLLSYAGPLFVLLGLCAALATSAGLLVLAPAALGIGCLLTSRAASRWLPRPGLDTAGSLVLAVALWNARGSREGAAFLLAALALACLWRASRETSLRPHLAFLVSGLGCGLLLSSPGNPLGMVPLALLALLLLSLVGLSPAAETTRKRPATLAAAALAGAAAGLAEAIAGGPSPWVFLTLWVGCWLLTCWLVRALDPAPNRVERGLLFASVVLANLAGGALLMVLLQSWGRPWAYAVGLGAWSWLHYGLFAVLRLRNAPLPLAGATYHSAHALGFASLPLAALQGGSLTSALCALGYAALCFESASLGIPSAFGLRGTAHALTLGALGLGLASGLTATLATLSGAAALFLWRSLRDAANAAHLWFLVLTTVGTAVATLSGRDSFLPLALLAVGVLGVARLLHFLGQSPAKVALTHGWALTVATVALPASWVTGDSSTAVSLCLWLGLAASSWRWRATLAATPQIPLARGGQWLLHASGASLVLAGLRDANLAVLQAPALALWAGGLLGLDEAFRGRLPATGVAPDRHATRDAVAAMTGLSLGLAAWRFEEPASAVACFLGALVFGWAERLQAVRWAGHLAAAAAIEGVWVLGFARGVWWPEAYLMPLGIYLAVLSGVRAPAGRAARGSWIGLHALALLALLATVGCPLVAVLLWPASAHLLFLAGGCLLLVYVFTASGQPTPLLVSVCGMFVAGVA